MKRLLYSDIAPNHPLVWVTGAAAVATAGVTGLLFFFLTSESIPLFNHQGFAFFSGRDWYPPEEHYGALPLILGSCVVTGLALVWSLPLALGTAVFTSEYLSPRLRWWVKSMMELLAGVPGIVYGLLGVTLLAQWVQGIFNLIDGNTFFTASLLLAVMILPTVMTLSEDALRAVPRELRQAALALGATRSQMVFGVALPAAGSGILGAVLLGLGRAMGETIAVMLVIGGRDAIPEPWFDVFQPGQNIPSKLGREAAESLGYGLQWSALMGLGLTLFVLVMTVSLVGLRLTRRSRL